MSTLPSPGQLGPEDAAALLRQAERSTRDAQGNAGWPSAVFLVGIGSVSSCVVAAMPWVHDHTAQRLLWGGMFLWLVILSVFLVLFMRRAKRGFGLRWTVSIGTWGVASGQALAGVVGPLIEVPVLIALVYVSLWAGKRLFKGDPTVPNAIHQDMSASGRSPEDGAR